MAGHRIKLINFMEFDFTPLKTFGQTAVWIADNVPIRPYRNGTLIVRFRSITLANASTTITFNVVPAAPTPEDPARFYRNLNKTYPSGGLSISGGVSGSALLYSKELTTDNSPLPDFVSVQMVVYQASVDTTFTFTADAELALKE